ncbi:MAG TPA: hypothetical protein VF883_14135 [Thermoanaerobaculia bacterium]|jgi:hypothetical protein
MNRRRFLQSTFSAAVVAIILSRCGFIGSDYVPTEKTLRRWAGTFVVEGAVNVEPLYGNIDVDSVIGRYEALAPPDAVLAEIERRATRAGWQVVQREGTFREFHRVTPGSFEIARVRINGARRVTVGWLQVDGSRTAEDAAHSVEGSWAAAELWPRCQKETASIDPRT